MKSLYTYIYSPYNSDHTFLEFQRWDHVPFGRKGGIVSGSLVGGSCRFRGQNHTRVLLVFPKTQVWQHWVHDPSPGLI